jgi:hypothetical protein
MHLQVRTTCFLTSPLLICLSTQPISTSSLREHVDISLTFQYSLPTPNVPFFKNILRQLINLQSPR